MSFSVVILSRDVDNLNRCVKSIRDNGERECRILLVDDGIDRSRFAYLDQVEIIPGAKPFNFSRNANLGIAAVDPDDVFLMNDDATLLTPYGFSNLVGARGELFGWQYGIISPSITENTGNLNQLPHNSIEIRDEPKVLCFICVYIPREVFQIVGELDERFVHYGCEDDDFCRRTINEGIQLGIWDHCSIGHDGVSSFRSGNDPTVNAKALAMNREIYRKKWGG